MEEIAREKSKRVHSELAGYALDVTSLAIIPKCNNPRHHATLAIILLHAIVSNLRKKGLGVGLLWNNKDSAAVMYYLF